MIDDGVEGGETGCRPLDHCHSYSPIECEDRRVRYRDELIVKAEYAMPVSLLKGECNYVAGGDASFQMKGRHAVTGRGALHMLDAALDQCVIPSTTVLLREKKQIAGGVLPHREAGCLKTEERCQCVRLWDAGNRVVGDDFGESKRLTTDIAAHHAITIERVISFIEHQVEHVEDRCHARRKHLRFDHSKRNPVLANVTFRADEALGYRALVDQIGRPISRTLNPPMVLSVSATRASGGIAGWQHVKIMRS